jgi:hypothetical protein
MIEIGFVVLDDGLIFLVVVVDVTRCRRRLFVT